MLKPYFKQILEISKRDEVREESYYSILENLLNDYSGFTDKKNIHITTLRKKTSIGWGQSLFYDFVRK